MANELTYQSEFTGQEMDARFTAVATLSAALEALTAVVAQKYVKPTDGIPATDMDADVQAALAKALTAVQSLADYYTKAEVDALLAAINAQEYVDVASLPTASASTMRKIFLVGPDGSGYYSYYISSYDGSAYSWVGPLGTTEISLANYATKAELNQLDQKVDGFFILGASMSSTKITANANSTLCVIPVVAGQVLKVTANATEGARVSITKSYAVGDIQFATGESQRSIAAEATSSITIASDGLYALITFIYSVPGAGIYTDRTPAEVLLNTIPILSPIEQREMDLAKRISDLDADLQGQIDDIEVTNPVIVTTDNLLDPDAVDMGYILDTDTGGGIHESSSYFTTDYIPVTANVAYCCNKAMRRMVLYDSSKAYSSRTDNISENTDVTPSVNGFIRFSVEKTNAPSATHFGDKTKEWDVAYSLKDITVKNIPIALKSNVPSNIFAGKKLAILGDSSAAVGATNWPSRLGPALGLQSCDLYAGGGYTWRNQTLNGALAKCIGKLIGDLVASGKTYDIILTQIGGNDLGGTDIQLGTIAAAFDSYNYKSLVDSADTASGIRYWLEYLKRTFPNALLIVDTVFQRQGSKTGESAKPVNDMLRAACLRLGIVCLNGEEEVGFSSFLEPSSPYYNDGNPGVANDRTDLSRENQIYNYIEDATGDIVDYATATDDGVLKTGYSKRYGIYTYDGKHQNLRGENKVLDFMIKSLKSLYQSDNLQHTDDPSSSTPNRLT